jgi:hypothetical protein
VPHCQGSNPSTITCDSRQVSELLCDSVSIPMYLGGNCHHYIIMPFLRLVLHELIQVLDSVFGPQQVFSKC